MKPVEFVMWLAGAMETFGEDRVPDAESWKRMYGKMAEAMGYIGTKKILEAAEKNVYEQEQKEDALAQLMAQKQYFANIQAQQAYKTYPTSTSAGTWIGGAAGAGGGSITCTGMGSGAIDASSTLTLGSSLLDKLNKL